MWELRFNNNKQWFDNNRERYRILFKEPFDAFAQDMNDMLIEKTGIKTISSVSRINRDIRFSKDKSPYRDHKWVVFKREEGRWASKPVMYFELGPDYYSVGMGIYDSTPQYMAAFRKKIDANTPKFERLIKPYTKEKEFKIIGDMYKKKYANDKSEAVMTFYQRRNLGFSCDNEINDLIYKRELLDYCLEKFMHILPMNKFMYEVSAE